MMLHAGLDLSRRRMDYCLLDEHGERLEVGAAPPDADGLAGLARHIGESFRSVPVQAAIESMNGARFVHDTLERCGWRVEVYRERHLATKRRLGRQRGPKVAQVDIARRLAEAIWHMLTRNQPFAPAGAAPALAA